MRHLASGFIVSLVAIVVVAVVEELVAPARFVSALFAVPMFLAALLLPPRATLVVIGLTLAVAVRGALLAPAPVNVWSLQAIGLSVAALLSYLLARRIKEVSDLNRRLEVANVEAEANAAKLRELEQMRKVFTQSIVHDLKNPLTVVLAGAHLLAGQTESPAQTRASVKLVEGSARQISTLLNSLTDWVRIESGQLRPDLQSLDYRALLVSMVDQYTSLAGPGRLRLEMAETVGAVCADRQFVERVLTNLLSNALKYGSKDGSIIVKVARRGQEVLTAVSDQGPGISPENLERIFSRYYRVRAEPSGTEGLGLGLYITKGLVEAMGGSIWAESIVGSGSTFCFTLPRA
jgi:signal transduction histidine kinase